MSGSAIAAWSGLAALLTITPGADMALVARSALAAGRRQALWTTAGIASGLVVWGAASAAGVAALLAASAGAYDALRLAGAAYLVWLGVRTLVRAGAAAPAPGPSGARAGRGSYATGLLSNLANPKIVVFYSTVLPSFVPAGASVLAWSLLLAAIHAGMGLVWLSAYAWALHRARAVLERPRVRGWLDRVTGTVLVALGIRLATYRNHPLGT
jgi:threonine/homoserine/homoserine lactone efflux protein